MLTNNKNDLLQIQNINCNNTSEFGQVRVEEQQQGSVQQDQEEINNIVFDSLPLSESDEEKEENNPSDFEKIASLTEKLRRWSIEGPN